MSSSYSVIIDKVSKQFTKDHLSRTILKDISFKLYPGQTLGLLGRSGAGKSTLLRCLNGLEIPDTGKIIITGEDLNSPHKSKIQQTIGTVFQNFNLLSRRNVLENISLPMVLQGTKAEDVTKRAKELADMVGLGNHMYHYPSELSGGQKQRVAIARSLATNCKLLLCDEFTSALDPETTYEILSLLADINKSLQLTMIIISHNLEVVREICDLVCVLDGGEMVEFGTLESILIHPNHSTTKNMIDITFQKDLPLSWSSRMGTAPTAYCQAVFNLRFTNKNAHKPILSKMIQELGLDLNIIAGHIDHIRKMAFGQLTVSLTYDEEKLHKFMTGLKEFHVQVDVLGYLKADD